MALVRRPPARLVKLERQPVLATVVVLKMVECKSEAE